MLLQSDGCGALLSLTQGEEATILISQQAGAWVDWRHVQGDGEEEETDNLVNEVLDEIGINLGEQMVAAPGQKAQVC